MNQVIFESKLRSDSKAIVEDFFNSIYAQGRFLWVLSRLVDRTGVSVNDAFCFFPDLSDPDPVFHFEGVMFGVPPNIEVVVTDVEFIDYVQAACRGYLKHHRLDKSQVLSTLKKLERPSQSQQSN